LSVLNLKTAHSLGIRYISKWKQNSLSYNETLITRHK